MRNYAGLSVLLSLALLAGCTKTVMVDVPPRMDLSRYEALGIIEFTSNADAAISARATQLFQESIQDAQPGTPFLDLGSRDAVLSAVGSTQFDADAFRKIGRKYGVAAVFLGDVAYSSPKTDIKITDIDKLEGGMRTEIRVDMSSKLIETLSRASVWSSSSWAKRQIGHLEVSAEQGVSGTLRNSDPREEMVPAMIFHLTKDFRPTSVRQKVN